MKPTDLLVRLLSLMTSDCSSLLSEARKEAGRLGALRKRRPMAGGASETVRSLSSRSRTQLLGSSGVLKAENRTEAHSRQSATSRFRTVSVLWWIRFVFMRRSATVTSCYSYFLLIDWTFGHATPFHPVKWVSPFVGLVVLESTCY